MSIYVLPNSVQDYVGEQSCSFQRPRLAHRDDVHDLSVAAAEL